jgi:hypothetical protein
VIEASWKAMEDAYATGLRMAEELPSGQPHDSQ